MDEQFSSNAGQASDSRGTAASIQEVVGEKAGQAKDKVAEFGRKAVDRLDGRREPTANALDQTASALHEKSEKAAIVAHRAADKLQDTADYIRQHDLKSMTDDVQTLIKRYPAQSLVVAAVGGFLVARALRRND